MQNRPTNNRQERLSRKRMVASMEKTMVVLKEFYQYAKEAY